MRTASWWMVLVAVAVLGCSEKESSSVREKELEVELAKAKAAQAQAEAEKARLEAMPAGEHLRDIQAAVTASKEAERARKKVEADAAQALKASQEAKDNLERAAKDLDALNANVAEAVTAVVEAQNDADRAAAKARLIVLQKEKAEIEQRVAEARAAVEKAERLRGVTISKECMDNPLAMGCS